MPIPPVNLGGNITTGQGPQLPSGTGPMIPSGQGNWFQQNGLSGTPPGTLTQAPYHYDPSRGNDPTEIQAFIQDRLRATQGQLTPEQIAQQIAYWQPKILAAGGLGDGSYWYARMSDPQGTGSNAGEGGGPGGGSGRSLQDLLALNPGYGIFQNLAGGMTPQQILQSNPGYQFAEQRGLDAIDTGAAAKGTLLTGGNQKDRADFATGLASQNWNNIWNQQLGLAGLGSNIYQGQVTNNQNLANLGRPT